MELEGYLAQKKALVEGALRSYLPPADHFSPKINEAIHYALLGGGKRLRPILTLAVVEMLKGDVKEALGPACALELIHTCSLVLDDLPSMDDASFRRGRPSCHKVYGEAVAILAAMALLNLAYSLIFSPTPPAEFPPPAFPDNYALKGKILEEITRAIGPTGLISGQLVDLESEGKNIDFETLEYIHRNKTGRLFIASVRMGGLMAGASAEELAALTRYAKNLGLAYQIRDDLLDATSTPKILGKDVGQDQSRTTFVSLCGLKEAQLLVERLTAFALENLAYFKERAEILRAFARYLSARTS